MEQEKSNSAIPHYPVRILELLLIIMGAFTLVSIALIGLGNKMLDNMFDPDKAEAIAKSLFDYKIPGGSVGKVGVNIGEKQMAIVNSLTNPPDITVFVSKLPIDRIKPESSLDFDIIFKDLFQDSFDPTTYSIENKQLCGKTVPVSIQEGQETFDNQISVPVIRYITKVTDNGVEKNIDIVVNGENAKDKAAEVFNSLQCRF
jgi:hypothetical protein